MIFSILLECFSRPEKSVDKKTSTISSATRCPTIAAPNAKTLASLCSLVSLALVKSEQSAHLIPLTLLAAIEIPIPVVQITMPLSTSLLATAFAASIPKSG